MHITLPSNTPINTTADDAHINYDPPSADPPLASSPHNEVVQNPVDIHNPAGIQDSEGVQDVECTKEAEGAQDVECAKEAEGAHESEETHQESAEEQRVTRYPRRNHSKTYRDGPAKYERNKNVDEFQMPSWRAATAATSLLALSTVKLWGQPP